jgi:hypothetical protein
VIERAPGTAPTSLASQASPVSEEQAFALENYTELIAALEEQANSGQALSETLSNQITPFFTGWGQADGDAAVAFAQTLEESQITTCTMAALTGWGKDDLPGAVAWVSQYETDGHEKVLYIGKLATSWKPSQTDQIQPLAEAWGAIDPAAATQWLLGLPASPAGNDTLQKVIIAWATADPSTASALLTSLPKSPAVDTALAALGKVMVVNFPAK